jgi:hypothetical protein
VIPLGTSLCAICSLVLSIVPAVGQTAGVRRIYVEPFAAKNGAAELRSAVVAELRKVPAISVVSARDEADAILSGDGEIWVRGYRSLNPRSGYSTANGTPVYTGFLSVELKDLKGDTLWSYLATPAVAVTNISKDLSRRIGRHLAEALAAGNGATSFPN